VTLPPPPAGLSDPRAYRQLADEIRRQISDGTLKPGDPAPTVTYLADRTGHARHTCGRALQLLQSEGLVKRFPAYGYFIAGPSDPAPQP
jgi:GntR family transcriptional regulator